MKEKTISVCVPVFNEEENLKETITKLLSEFKSSKWKNVEIIVINDGSTDKTEMILNEFKDQISIVSHPENQGYGSALKSGIKVASNETILILDADLTYPIDDALKLFQRKNLGFNMVVGARQSKHLNDKVIKGKLRRILGFLVNYATGRKIEDVNSGFRIFSRNEIFPYLSVLCNTFSFTTSLTIAYLLTGKTIDFVPIAYGTRGGSSKVNLRKDMVRTLQYIIQMIILFNPLKLFILISTIFAVFGVLCSIVLYLLNFEMSSVLFASMFLSALSFLFGLLADQKRLLKLYKFNG